MFSIFISKNFFSSLSTYYKTLGITKGTSQVQIKKRYYQLAKTYHPDVNKQQNAHQKFAQITKAYNFIVENFNESDNQNNQTDNTFYKNGKRYNPYETHSQKRTKAQFEEDWEDFQTFDSFYRTHKKFKKAKRGQDIYVNATISLAQSFKGVKKTLKFSRKVNCHSCSTQQPETCIACGGKGQIFHRKNKQKISCSNCDGFGYKIQCSTCQGSRFIYKDVQQEIYIEKGTHDKSILRVKNNGHQGFKHNNGDLYVTIIIQQSQSMKIDGNNVHSQIELQYITAIFGGQIQLQTIQGKKTINVPAGTQSGNQLRLFNYGIKSPFSNRIGDHIIKFKIKVPKKLTDYQKKLMNQLMREESY